MQCVASGERRCVAKRIARRANLVRAEREHAVGHPVEARDRRVLASVREASNAPDREPAPRVAALRSSRGGARCPQFATAPVKAVAARVHVPLAFE